MPKTSKTSNERSDWHDSMHLMADTLIGLSNHVISQTSKQAERRFSEIAITNIEQAISTLERIVLREITDKDEQDVVFQHITQLMQWAMYTGGANAHAAKSYMEKCDLRDRRLTKKEARGEDLVAAVVREEAAAFWVMEPEITGSTKTAKRILAKVNDRLSALNADGKVAVAALDVSAIQKRVARLKNDDNG